VSSINYIDISSVRLRGSLRRTRVRFLLLQMKVAAIAAADMVAAAAEVCAGQLSIRTGRTAAPAAPAAPGLLRGTCGTDLVGSLKGVRERMSINRLDS